MSAFEKIIGYDSVKAELKMLCDCWKHPDKYEKLGCKPPHGLLLSGEPGIGKTLFATCMIEECGLPHFVCRKDKSNEAFLEELKAGFENAKASAPAILLLDDMDKFSNDSVEEHRDTEEYVAVQSLMDDAKECGVYVIATVNCWYNLPSSLLRSGRFDVKIRMQMPQIEDTEKIIKHYLEDKTYAFIDADLKDIAGILIDNSCADIASVVNEAALYAGYENRGSVTKDDLIRACLRKFFEAPESYTEVSPEVRLRIAYHEAGHAVIAETLEPESVNLISIKACDGDTGGVTSLRRNRDYWQRVCYQENRILARLGGKAASELVFGEVDAGFSCDMKNAINVLERFRDDYAAYGFDKRITHESPSGIIEDADRAVAEQLEEYYKKAKRILAEHRSFLDKLSKELMDNETLLSSDIKRIRQSSDK